MKVLNTNEQDELILDLLNQACGDIHGEIDNRCIAVYEDACIHLKNKGMLEEVNSRIYNIVDMDKWKINKQ